MKNAAKAFFHRVRSRITSGIHFAFRRGRGSGLEWGNAQEWLCGHDVVSFDIFDTLVLRRCDQPADVFDAVGQKLGRDDFRRIRTEAEKTARQIAMRERGTLEVSIRDIYGVLEKEYGIPAEEGIDTEFQTELEYCFANPELLDVFQSLRQKGRTVVIVSDMYLPHGMMERLLEHVGYTGYEKLYVSCDYGRSKGDGSLFRLVQSEYRGRNIVHIGDNERSDVENARRCGIDSVLYTSRK